MKIILDEGRGLIGEPELEALKRSGLLDEPELEERSIPSVDLEMYGPHFGDMSDEYHTTPIEPEDGIIALPMNAHGVTAEEEEAEPILEEEKKSIMMEIRRSLTDFADKVTGRQPGTGKEQVVLVEDEKGEESVDPMELYLDLINRRENDVDNKLLEGLNATIETVSKIAEQLTKIEPPVVNIENVIPESKSEPPVVNIENVMPEMPVKMDVTVKSPDEVLETETITHRDKDGFIQNTTRRTTRK